jgi:hypothetical protein
MDMWPLFIALVLVGAGAFLGAYCVWSQSS